MSPTITRPSATRQLLDTIEATPFITDGGLETTLVFHDGIDLPDFASFPLLDRPDGRAALVRYFAAYLAVAERDGVGIVLDTPTWRANPDWGIRQGYDEAALAELNRRSVAFVRGLAAAVTVPTLVNGVIGPRGDGYVVGEAMTAAEAAAYHAPQIRAFAEAGADLVSAITMTDAAEAIGIVRAAEAVGLPSVVSFTVETDGRLPSTQPLGEAILETDEATGGAAAWFMVNCAHPSHVDGVLAGGDGWRSRIRAVRANASRMSHEELDDAEELDRGVPAELADDYVRLRTLLPELRIVGGCCGTDHEHIDAISRALH